MIEQYKFTITGNQLDKRGNAVPKLKMTGKQHWTDKAQMYVAWKAHVRACFTKCSTASRAMLARTAVDQKPIVLDGGQQARMDILIDWADEKHGDPENIFGSIADALFHNDKHLAGSFDFAHSPTKEGSVAVVITISSAPVAVDAGLKRQAKKVIQKT